MSRPNDHSAEASMVIKPGDGIIQALCIYTIRPLSCRSLNYSLESHTTYPVRRPVLPVAISKVLQLMCSKGLGLC